MNLRVSATDIDAFRRYRDDEEADLAAFLDQMRRKIEPTPAMKAGTALHKALETSKAGEYRMLSADGYRFVFMTDGEVDIPDIRERKGTRIYRIGDCDVTLVGKVDAIHGRRIDDHKLTGRFDAERFMSSYQWRIYLEIFGADEFRWNIFEGRATDEKPWEYLIYNVHLLTQHRYPRMSEDVERELELFVEFASHHLPERFEATNYLRAG